VASTKPGFGVKVIVPVALTIAVPLADGTVMVTEAGLIVPPMLVSLNNTDVVTAVAAVVGTPKSSIASMVADTAATTAPEQAVITPVHNGSPPPVTVAVLFPPVEPTAVAPTVIGMVTVIGPTEFAGIVHPDKLVDPVAIVQLPSDEPLTSTAPLVEIPFGKASASDIDAVVGPFAIAMLMV
jgi:hypothetical protein